MFRPLLGVLVITGLVLAAGFWSSIAVQYHSYRLRSEKEYLMQLLAKPRSQAARRALHEFMETPRGAERALKRYVDSLRSTTVFGFDEGVVTVDAMDRALIRVFEDARFTADFVLTNGDHRIIGGVVEEAPDELMALRSLVARMSVAKRKIESYDGLLFTVGDFEEVVGLFARGFGLHPDKMPRIDPERTADHVLLIQRTAA